MSANKVNISELSELVILTLEFVLLQQCNGIQGESFVTLTYLSIYYYLVIFKYSLKTY